MSLVIFIMAWMDRQRRGFIFCVCLLVLTLCVEALFVRDGIRKTVVIHSQLK